MTSKDRDYMRHELEMTFNVLNKSKSTQKETLACTEASTAASTSLTVNTLLKCSSKNTE